MGKQNKWRMLDGVAQFALYNCSYRTNHFHYPPINNKYVNKAFANLLQTTFCEPMDAICKAFFGERNAKTFVPFRCLYNSFRNCRISLKAFAVKIWCASSSKIRKCNFNGLGLQNIWQTNNHTDIHRHACFQTLILIQAHKHSLQRLEFARTYFVIMQIHGSKRHECVNSLARFHAT